MEPRDELMGGESQGLVPSANLRLWLLIGALAVLVNVCLAGASFWIEFSRHRAGPCDGPPNSLLCGTPAAEPARPGYERPAPRGRSWPRDSRASCGAACYLS